MMPALVSFGPGETARLGGLSSAVSRGVFGRLPSVPLVAQATGAWRASRVDGSGLQLIDLTPGGRNMRFGGNGSTPTTNDPKLLTYTGTRYLYLPGASGNYASVPDSPALDITGDLDIDVDVALDDWTPAGNQPLLTKYRDSTGNTGYELRQRLTTGVLTLIWGDGTTLHIIDSTVAHGLTDGARHTIRATLDVDNGAGGHDVKFYVDGVQLGATVTTAGATSVATNTSAVAVGSRPDATNPATGKFYAAVVKDGIGGTTVLDVDFTDAAQFPDGGASVTGTAATGQTVTINRSTGAGRKSCYVTQPTLLLGTDDFLSLPHDPVFDVGVDDDLTVVTVLRSFGTAAADQAIVSKQTDGNSTAAAGYSLYRNSPDSAFIKASNGSAAALSDFTSAAVVTSGALQTFSAVLDRTAATGEAFVDGISNGSAPLAAVDLSSTEPLSIGRANLPRDYLNAEVLGVAIFVGRVLTATEIARVASELGA